MHKLVNALIFSFAAICPLHSDIIWSLPVDLSDPMEKAIGAKVAVDTEGKAVVIWSGFDGSNYLAQSRSAIIGDPWSRISTLSPSGENALYPSITSDNFKNTMGLWACWNGNQTQIWESLFKEKIGWGRTRLINEIDAINFIGFTPNCAFDPAGNAVAVWQINDGSINWIQSATKIQGKEWSKPENIATPNTQSLKNFQPKVVMDPNSNAIALWSNEATLSIQSAVAPLRGTWSNSIDVSEAGQYVGQQQIVIDNQGNITALWIRFDGQFYVVQTANKPAAGEWSPPSDLSVPGENALSPQLAVDPFGTITAIWYHLNGFISVIETASKTVNGEWSQITALSNATDDANEPQICAAANGDVFAVWKISDGSNFIIQAAHKPLNGIWQRPVSLSALEQDTVSPQLALDSNGNAVVVWQRHNGVNSNIQAVFGIKKNS